MDYEAVVELVDEMPVQDKQRLATHLRNVLIESEKPTTPDQAHHARVRDALENILAGYELAPDDPARALSDSEAGYLLAALHRETAGAAPLSAAVIEDRD